MLQRITGGEKGWGERLYWYKVKVLAVGNLENFFCLFPLTSTHSGGDERKGIMKTGNGGKGRNASGGGCL